MTLETICLSKFPTLHDEDVGMQDATPIKDLNIVQCSLQGIHLPPVALDEKTHKSCKRVGFARWILCTKKKKSLAVRRTNPLIGDESLEKG